MNIYGFISLAGAGLECGSGSGSGRGGSRGGSSGGSSGGVEAKGVMLA